jgi:hypothetical protein
MRFVLVALALLLVGAMIPVRRVQAYSSGCYNGYTEQDLLNKAEELGYQVYAIPDNNGGRPVGTTPVAARQPATYEVSGDPRGDFYFDLFTLSLGGDGCYHQRVRTDKAGARSDCAVTATVEVTDETLIPRHPGTRVTAVFECNGQYILGATMTAVWDGSGTFTSSCLATTDNRGFATCKLHLRELPPLEAAGISVCLTYRGNDYCGFAKPA